MKDRRFDQLTRSLTHNGSRRTLLRVMGGGVALLVPRFRPHEALANHGTSGPGDPCRHDNQCVAADVPLVCAWNGHGHDGDYNCCTNDGNGCADDSWCCGTSVCSGGVCGGGGGGGDASAGDGGMAISDAAGGSTSIGDVDSGGNTGNVVDVGNTGGNVNASGGYDSDTTDVNVDDQGGVSDSDAQGGSDDAASG
jgi:hypothetical protein